MGVLNVTPDSFSDGGHWLDVHLAVAHGLAMVEAGADLVDVGGESTRPGAQRVAPDEELSRVMPVIEGLLERGVVVSIDTMWAATARAAVEAGAVIVNDVSGGLADPAMLETVARLGTPYVAMHWRGHSDTMQELSDYDDVVSEVVSELAERRQAAIDAGIDPRALVLDPGLGFAKEPSHNWALLRQFDRLLALGHPVLVGASRKRFLGELLAEGGVPRAMSGRDVATDAVTALAAAAGAWCVRVHDVAGSRDAVRVAAAWLRG
ncbi:MAG: dihydropteroate synthase [Actinobacteria bacterium]|uniref:dihydropteroate synthase n=1 Tax=freshwater metagenome TaxID=449393 RepID=A0A6J7S3M7_9ZZZZ|nr:dihydropteroate synthase [Actinomycetota bacterium]